MKIIVCQLFIIMGGTIIKKVESYLFGLSAKAEKVVAMPLPVSSGNEKEAIILRRGVYHAI